MADTIRLKYTTAYPLLSGTSEVVNHNRTQGLELRTDKPCSHLEMV